MSKHEIKIDTGNSVKNIKTLNDSLEESREKLEGLEQKADNISKAAKGLKGGFESAVGAIAMFGTESEKANEILTKLSGAMNISNGVKDLFEGAKNMRMFQIATNDGAKAMGTLKKALISTGLGAIVVLVGSLVANWKEFTEALGVSEGAMNKVKDTFNGVLQVIKDGTAGIAKSFARLVKGDFKGALEELKSGFNVAESYNAGFNKRVEEEAAEREKLRQEKLKVAREAYQNSLNQLLEKYKDYGKSERQILKENFDKEMKLAANNQELRKKIQEKYNAELLALDKTEQDKNLQELQKARGKQFDDLKNTLSSQQLELAEMYLDNAMTYEDYIKSKEELDREYLENYIQLLKTQLEEEGLADEERINLIDRLRTAQESLIKAPEEAKQQSEEVLEHVNTVYENVRDNIDSLGNSLGTLFSSIASNLDENSEEYKALMTVQTIVTTLTGVMSAITSAMDPSNAWMTLPGQIALAATTSASVIAAGASTIKQINSATENSNISAPNISTSSTRQSPSYSYNLKPSSEIEGEDNKVYVVESDITKTQKKKNLLKTQVRF